MNTLDDLSNPKFYEKIKNLPKPEYIVYLFINDHFNRLYVPYKGILISTDYDDAHYEVNPQFIMKDNKIIAKDYSKLNLFFKGLYTVKAYYNLYSQVFGVKNSQDKMFEAFKMAKSLTDEHFPDSKFIIIDYKDGGHLLMPETLQKRLIEEGFVILDAEDLAGHELISEKWRTGDKEHPNGAAFYDVTEGLIKALDLKVKQKRG